MKKIMMIGSALLVLSSSVFATEARLLALGMKETDNEGMYYIQDGRNIFLNSAYVNNYADQLVTEYGGAGRVLNGLATATTDAVYNAKAQGGFFKKYGEMVYGFYYGNESNTSSLLRVLGTADTTGNKMLQTADNQIDLFIAGDAGLKWGANLLYSNGKDEGTLQSKDTAVTTRLGLIGSNWDAHANVSLASKSEMVSATGTQAFKGKLGLHVGGSYEAGAGRAFGYIKNYSWEQENTGSTTIKGSFTSYYLGYGSDMTVNTSDKIIASVALRKTDINVKFASASTVHLFAIPLTLGYEAKANDWLTLRGSIVQNLYGKKDNGNLTSTSLNPTARVVVAATYGTSGKGTIANSTEVNAGATIALGQVSIDGVVGISGAARNAPNSSVANNGVLTGDNLLSKVGLTYKF